MPRRNEARIGLCETSVERSVGRLFAGETPTSVRRFLACGPRRHGFSKHGFGKHGFGKHGFGKHGFGKHDFVSMASANTASANANVRNAEKRVERGNPIRYNGL